MTQERMLRSMVMGAALALGVTGCPPEPPGDDAGVTGGWATAGTSSGGIAAGGGGTGGTASVPVCATVPTLPAMGTACATLGESQCDSSGNQCVCARGIWHCTTNCATSYPSEPAPGSPCVRGAACNYPSGLSCDCPNTEWLCFGANACPADVPVTGSACNAMTDIWCDYPNQNPSLHFACVCLVNANPSTGSTWTCWQSAMCPATQPAYDLARACTGNAFCGYGSTRCGCFLGGTPWICGLGILTISFGNEEPPPAGG